VTYSASENYLAIGDVNGDGHMDICTGEFGPTVYLYINNGQGVFSLGGTATLSGFPFAIGDIDGDGIADIVDSAGCVALGLGNVQFAPDSCYEVPLAEDSYNVVLADLRNNGLKDVILGLNPMTSVLLNDRRLKPAGWPATESRLKCERSGARQCSSLLSGRGKNATRNRACERPAQRSEAKVIPAGS
jgi:hypothetical protein